MRVLTACLATTVGCVLPLFLTGALGVQVQADLQLTDAAFGVVITTHHLGGVVVGAALGRRVDVVGWPRAVVASGLAAAVSLLGVAWWAHTGWQLAICLVVGGLGHAGSMAGVNLAIAEEVPLRRHALAFGLKQAAPTAGFLLAGLSLPWVALTLGWRWAYVLGAVLVLVAAGSVPMRTHGTGAQRRVRSESRAGRRVVLDPATRRMAIAGGFAATSVSALASFLVISNVASGLAPASAGLLAATCSVLGIVVRVGLGVLADRTRTDGLRLTAGLLFTGCVGYACLAVGHGAVVVVGSLVAFGAGWGWPGLFHFGVVRMNPQAPAAATGLAHSAISAGSSVGPLAFGLIAERLSYGHAWMMVTVVAFLGGALVLTARPGAPAVAARPMEAGRAGS